MDITADTFFLQWSKQPKKLKNSSDESSASSCCCGHNISFRPEKMVDVKKEPISSRKIQKAERAKIRRDKLNEQFLELEDALGYYCKLIQ